MSTLEMVTAVLAYAGISPSTEELQEYAAEVDDVRATIDALYAIEAARYESPAPVFDASW